MESLGARWHELQDVWPNISLALGLLWLLRRALAPPAEARAA